MARPRPSLFPRSTWTSASDCYQDHYWDGRGDSDRDWRAAAGAVVSLRGHAASHARPLDQQPLPCPHSPPWPLHGRLNDPCSQYCLAPPPPRGGRRKKQGAQVGRAGERARLLFSNLTNKYLSPPAVAHTSTFIWRLSGGSGEDSVRETFDFCLSTQFPF